MNTGGFRLVAYIAFVTCLSPGASHALELYYNNVDSDLPGEGLTPNGVWAWTSGPDAVFADAVTENDGVSGTQSFRQTTDATGAVGTSSRQRSGRSRIRCRRGGVFRTRRAEPCGDSTADRASTHAQPVAVALR